MNESKISGKGNEISFDAKLLSEALRYHLSESGMGEEEIAEILPSEGVSARVERATWENFNDNERVSWLLEASREKASKRKGFGLGSHIPGLKHN